MQIVSASRRTDIPAFYSEWLMNRLREGHALVPNSFNPRQVSRVPLRPDEVACLVLVTKDPRPMIRYLEELDLRGYRYYFQVTLTGLPKVLEPGVPEPAAVIDAMQRISKRIGPRKMIWRFDPILLSLDTSPEIIIGSFANLADRLAGSTERVIISFARRYRSVDIRLRRAALQKGVDFLSADSPEKGMLAAALANAAAKRGLMIQSCADPEDLTRYGISPGSCIDVRLIRELFGIELAGAKDRSQRSDCRCARSIDLGIYGTCPHGCIYCYASCDSALAAGRRHSPEKPSLLEDIGPAKKSHPDLFPPSEPAD